MTRKVLAGDPQRAAKITGRIPMPRLGMGADIAASCIFLCSEEGNTSTASRCRSMAASASVFEEGVNMSQEYTASVLVGAKDIHVERATQALGPGMVRVRLGAAGICGTDLHYYRNFANADFCCATR